MKDYEGIFITKPSLSDEMSQKLLDQIADEISKNGGKVDNVEKWGKKNLPYSIKKNREGIYYKLDFKIDADKVSGLHKTYRLNEDILRIMITKKVLKSGV